MNICFVACFNKTIFFKKIADELEKKGNNVFWISVSNKWTDYLSNEGVKTSNILHLKQSESIKMEDSNHIIQLIHSIEENSVHTLKQVYSMDRILSKKPWDEIFPLFKYITKNISNFLSTNNINITFGEATAAHEILASMISKSLNKYYFVPFTIRIPFERFVFFDGHLQKNFYDISAPDWDLKKTESFLNEYRKTKPKPSYYYKNNQQDSYRNITIYKKVYEKIKEYFIEKNDNFSQKSLYHQLFYEKKYLKAFYAKQVKKKIKFIHIDTPGNYVLYAMHVQPEASIDVLGIENNNQYETIKKIALSLPSHYTLLVKEHSNALGTRTPSELRKIASIPGVKLTDPFQNTLELLKYVDLVCTVSGTVAFESTLLGKKSLTLSPMFFNILPLSFFDINPINTNKYILQQDCNDEVNLINSLHHILFHSHKGIISDPVSFPDCISKENIDNVANAFISLIKKIG